MLIIKTDIEKI